MGLRRYENGRLLRPAIENLVGARLASVVLYSLLGTVDELVLVAALVRALHPGVRPQRLRVLVELGGIVEVGL